MKEKFKEKLSVFNNMFKDKINEFKKNNIDKKIIVISIFVFVFSIFIMISTSNITKEKVINNFKLAIENEDIKLLSKVLKVNEERVDSKKLIPLLKYYRDKEDSILNITKELRTANKSGMLEVKSRKVIFTKEYYIDVNKVSVEVKSNFDNTEVTINNKNVKSGEMLNDIIPGNYIAKYKLNTAFGDISGQLDVTIIDGNTININVDAGNITLYSEYKNANVFIQGKNIGKKVSDIVNFGPIPLNRDIKLYIENEFPWGKIRSDVVSINKSGIIKLDINMVNDKLISQVDSSLNTFFISVFDALNEEDKSLIKNADDDTEDKIYDDIFKKTVLFTNGYKISDLKLHIEKSEFKYEDETYKGNVVVKINYDIYKNILPFLKESREEMFLVNLIYENENWVLKDIQKFNVYE